MTGPSFGVRAPFAQMVRVRDIREHTMDIQPQAVIAGDNVETAVDGLMCVRPSGDEESIRKTFRDIDRWKRAVIQLAMTDLRRKFGDLALD